MRVSAPPICCAKAKASAIAEAVCPAWLGLGSGLGLGLGLLGRRQALGKLEQPRQWLGAQWAGLSPWERWAAQSR